jgi:DNA helicase IV
VARDPEIEGEQRYLDAAYARLDDMRRSAARVAEGYADVRRGGTHQARLERDIAAATTRRRLAALQIGDSPLCFGRIDLDDGPRYYIGRLSVTDADQTPLVIDWRAPVAEPFYRATPVEPMGVVRRRHFLTRGRELLGLDDEVFDTEATADAGLTVVGEGALLAAIERERTGRMGDIVATIQAEQDEAIRADVAGMLIVSGGPGTGKTAVALHRAAYLVYTHRRRLASQGVLLVGPNRIFLRYIDEVLPALGEEEVQLSTANGLKPQLTVTGHETAFAAKVKGDPRMATIIANAIADRERALPRDLVVTLDGHRLRLTSAESARIIEHARQRRGTHNERRPLVTRLVVDHLIEQFRQSLIRAYRRDVDLTAPEAVPQLELDSEELVDVSTAAALARGGVPPAEWQAELATRLRRIPAVKAALWRMWPVLRGMDLVHDLFSFETLIQSAARRVLSRAEQTALFRPRSAGVDAVDWTDADVALIDEADSILGPPAAARRRPRGRRHADQASLEAAGRVVDELGLRGYTTAAALAERYGAGEEASSSDDGVEPRTFGHVLVDEAQDLSAMEWRMVARRCPSLSMTLVGDFGQASRPGALDDWEDVIAAVESTRGGKVSNRLQARRVVLSVNYRTPAEIMQIANRVLAAAAPGIESARSVRTTGVVPSFEAVRADELVRAGARIARRACAEPGTVAVIAPPPLHKPLVVELSDVGAVADTAESIDAPIAILDAVDAKGLEFDHVIIIEPSLLVAPDAAGLRLLYVTLTRATQRLSVVHAEPLPEALEPGVVPA